MPKGGMVRPERALRVGVLDNDALVLLMIRRLFAQQKDVKLIWLTRDPVGAVQLCLDPRSRPDVILVDMALDGMTGMDVCRRLVDFRIRVRCIGMTSYSVDAYAHAAEEVGMACVVQKEDFPRLIQLVLESPSQETNSKTAGLDDVRGTAYRSQALSDREHEMMKLYSQGMGTKEIMGIMNVSKSTLWSYEQRALEKLHAKNRVEAIAICVRFHLFD